MSGKARLRAALAGAPVDRPPVWIMRQAGRYLPEYRALKERHSFRELVRTPELAVEVTLQPLRRFPLDAAITFSDILVVPEALGVGYQFVDNQGIRLERAVCSRGDLALLEAAGAVERLGYVGEIQRRLLAELRGEQALLGFCGSPWTLAVYLMTGGGLKDAGDVGARVAADMGMFRELMEILTEVSRGYLQMQAAAGVDAVQVFDSAAALCPADRYGEWSAEWIGRLVEGLGVPALVYVQGGMERARVLAAAGVRALSLDEHVDLQTVRAELGPEVVLQGNLPPALMSGPPEGVRGRAAGLLEKMGRERGYIFNLGHGIRPDAHVETMDALVETVVNWKP